MKKWRKFGAAEMSGKIKPITRDWWYSDGEYYSIHRDHSNPVKFSREDVLAIGNGVLGFSDEIDDTERLEWLIKSEIYPKVCQLSGMFSMFDPTLSEGHSLPPFQTAREAIDDAMRREQE